MSAIVPHLSIAQSRDLLRLHWFNDDPSVSEFLISFTWTTAVPIVRDI